MKSSLNKLIIKRNNMKNNIYIIALALAATAFTGCSHDYNYDGEYDIAGYFHGSDPRNNLVSFASTTQKYDNDFAAGISTGQDSHTFTFTANISRNLKNATTVQVAFAADAPLLTTTYKDYKVATADQVTLPNKGIFEISKELTQLNIPITVNGLKKMDSPTVVPVRITPTNDELKSPTGTHQDYAYILINPKEQWIVALEGDGASVKMASSGNTYSSTNTLYVDFAIEKAIDQDCKVGLERNNSIFKSDGNKELAPEGITVTTKENAKGQQEIQATIELQHAEKFTKAGEYVLPMRAIFYDKEGKKHYISGGEILIPINVVDIAFAHSSTSPSGTEIPSEDFTLSLSNPLQYGSIDNLTDGVTNQYGYMPEGTTTLSIDLKHATTVKGLKIGMYILTGFEYYTKSVKIFGSTDGKKWLPLSEEINFQEQTWNNINATKNVKVRYLKLEFNVQDYLGSLSEIKIFK